MDYRLLGILFLGGVLIIGATSVGFADSTYDLHMSGTVDIPAQTVSIDGTEHSFSSIGKVGSDSSFSASVSGPEGKLYSVLLYNNDEQIEDSERVNGSGTVTFPTSDLTPGTYVMAVEGADGQIKEIQPVVVKGYSVDINVAKSSTVGESVTVNVTVTQVDSSSESLSSVTVAVTHKGDHREVTASKVDSSTYQASVTLDETGTFGIYAGARGQGLIDRERQLIGLSDKASITVESAQTETPTPTEASDGGSATSSPTPSPTGTATSDSATESPVSQTPTTTPPSETKPTTTTADTVVTPAATDSPTATKTTVTTPLTAIQWLILILFGVAAGLRVRQQ